jgi:hypothetical protein
VIFDFETHSSELELGNTAHLLLASTVSVAMPQLSRDMSHAIMFFLCLLLLLLGCCLCFL